MTKAQALQAWFEQFLPAYTSASVPEDVVFPWLTYDAVFSAFGEEKVTITVNLWYYTESEALPNAKAEEISKAIGLGGAILKCDDGYIWLTRGSPFCQSIKDDSDPHIKRRYINISAEYLTN